MQKERRTWEEPRRSFGKTEIDEKAWLVNKPHKNVKVKEENDNLKAKSLLPIS